MIKLRTGLLALGSALLLSACASNSNQGASTAPSTENFYDESVQKLFATLPASYRTDFFALGIPQGWKVLSFSNHATNTHISVEKIDHSALVTIRVDKSVYKSIDDTCHYAQKGFEANGLTFTTTPNVSYGTCIIEGKENNKDVALWLRQYDDDNSVYSITYTGSLDVVGELLGYLVGNEKMMQLLVRPL